MLETTLASVCFAALHSPYNQGVRDRSNERKYLRNGFVLTGIIKHEALARRALCQAARLPSGKSAQCFCSAFRVRCWDGVSSSAHFVHGSTGVCRRHAGVICQSRIDYVVSARPRREGSRYVGPWRRERLWHSPKAARARGHRSKELRRRRLTSSRRLRHGSLLLFPPPGAAADRRRANANAPVLPVPLCRGGSSSGSFAILAFVWWCWRSRMCPNCGRWPS